MKRITAEIEKLRSYTGDKGSIDEKDIDLLVNKTKEDSIFAMTTAISERNAAKALSVFKDLLYQGVQPLMIFAMIVREIRLLLYAKLLLNSGRLEKYHPGMDYPQFQKQIYPIIKQSGQSGEMAGMHPYSLFNTLKNSSGFSKDECIALMEQMLAADIALKTTGQDPFSSDGSDSY